MGFLAAIPHKTEGANKQGKTIKKLEKELKEFGFESGDFVKRLMQVSMDFFPVLLKVSQFRKQVVKPRILPKNEQMNSFLLVCDVFLFVFLKKLRTPQRHFEII